MKQGPRFTLRQPRAGDPGWVIWRHGIWYGEHEGYDIAFEALVAKVCGEFFENHDPARERCWIGEIDGQNVGCIFCCKKSETEAKLRMLLVEPPARGMGLGARLIDECVNFARDAGYKKMSLWTHQSLTAARRLYEQAGFKLVRSEPNPAYRRDLVDEFWEMHLDQH
jgi:GNAT superfamily N-acetyltransferase